MKSREYNGVLKKVVKHLNDDYLPDVVEDTDIPYLWLWRLCNEVSRPRKPRVLMLADYYGIKYTKTP